LSQPDVQFFWGNKAGGSANQANISPDIIKSYRFLLPPLPEQRSIAAVLSSLDDNGFPVMQYVWGQFWVSNHSHVLQGRNGFSTEVLYVILKKTNIIGIVNGAVQLKINQSNLLNFEILIPTIDILKIFDSMLQPMFNKLKNIDYQIQTLSSIRDAILPKLMKGEVRVQGVYDFV
jgi:restriction endonuclease S subunit